MELVRQNGPITAQCWCTKGRRTTLKALRPLALSILALSPAPTAAQSAIPFNSGEAEIIVTARRAGAPLWTVDTPKGAVLLVGEIREIPEAARWRPDRLEAAARNADRILLGTRAKISPGDIFRLIFNGGKLVHLPEERVAADYLAPAQLQRLAMLEKRYEQDYSRRNFLMTAFDLLSRRLDFDDDSGPDAREIVEDAADDADIPAEPIGTLRGEDMLDDLFAAPPETHLACLDAAMTAAEEGPAVIEQRAADWTGSNVPAVMRNPLEQALGQCWPWADDALGPELRGQWVAALHAAIRTEGVTLAVVPLRVLAEEDGVLDWLKREGFEIAGPAWRSEPHE